MRRAGMTPSDRPRSYSCATDRVGIFYRRRAELIPRQSRFTSDRPRWSSCAHKPDENFTGGGSTNHRGKNGTHGSIFTEGNRGNRGRRVGREEAQEAQNRTESQVSSGLGSAPVKLDQAAKALGATYFSHKKAQEAQESEDSGRTAEDTGLRRRWTFLGTCLPR